MTAFHGEMENENSDAPTMTGLDAEENQRVGLLQKKLERTERLLLKSEKYNEELRKQVESLSQELHQFKNDKSSINQSTQTSVDDYLDAGGEIVIENNWLKETTNENMSIADCVKAVAEEALQQTSFVYDETSGLYFDSSSGYYYDPENALYYNSATGTYYTYDQTTQTYSFHSQVDLAQYNNSSEDKDKEDKSEKSTKKRKKKSHRESRHHRSRKWSSRRRKHDDYFDDDDYLSFEEGECSDSSEDSNSAASLSNYSGEERTSKYPPCIRCMVEESKIEALPAGTLYIVTCSGATIGREKYNDIRIPDLQISKMHAQITYYAQQKFYTVTDLGSQNGTCVNGIRIAEPKQTSEPYPLKHEDVLEVGDVRMLLHIHPGLDTCDQCEPGQVQAVLSAGQSKPMVDILSKAEKEQQRRRELKQIRKKFGLETCDFEETSNNKQDPSYNDRASQRRKAKGVDNPYGKTEAASVDVAIRQDNKGRKLLEKMGWAEGTSLGKSQQGIVEPISVDVRTSKAGLGSFNSFSSHVMIKSAAKQETLRKTRQRYDDTL